MENNGGNIQTQPKKILRVDAHPWIPKIWQLVEPVCQSEGMELVNVEFHREQSGRILRIYVDKPGGVRLDDCVHISRQVDDLLEVYLDETQTGPAYTLEVSSPGLSRPLVKEEDFQRFQGHRIYLKTLEPVEGRKNFKGTLLGLSAETVGLQLEDEKAFFIPWAVIKKAQLLENDNGVKG